MWKSILLTLSGLAFAFFILFVSIFRTASVKYDFNPHNPDEVNTVLGESTSQVEYFLPYPGKVLPDSPFWPAKAMRDKLWLVANTSATREAELKLLFADKRLGSAVVLFDKGKEDLAFSTLTKAEKYLEEAMNLELENRKIGIDTSDFLHKLALSSLKHYEVTEYLLGRVSDEMDPEIINMQQYSMRVYEHSRNSLLEINHTPPENPFNW